MRTATRSALILTDVHMLDATNAVAIRAGAAVVVTWEGVVCSEVINATTGKRHVVMNDVLKFL